MRYVKTALLGIATSGALVLSPAWGAKPPPVSDANAPNGAHYSNGSAQVTCGPDTQDPTVIRCSGTSIGGVGNTNATLDFSVTYSATVTCTNNGGNTVPVKTQFPTTSSITLTPDPSRNGTLIVPAVVSAGANEEGLLAQAQCPNNNWSKTLVADSVAVQGYTYTLTFVGYTTPFISISQP